MIVSAIVQATSKSDHTVENIICFDDCIFCGKKRTKIKGKKVKTNIGTLYVHIVKCFCCDGIHHDYLDQEHTIITMLNRLGIIPEDLDLKI